MTKRKDPNKPTCREQRAINKERRARVKALAGRFSKDHQPNPENAGRIPAEIDPEAVKKLAAIHCTAEEIASVLGCAVDTIYARFSAIVKQGHEEGQMSIKRKMHTKALEGNGDTGMLIWLSKQRCGYRERPLDEVQQTTINVHINEVPNEE